jgi:UDP-glucose 4-epimerase
MRIGITGAAGLIGGSLLKQLAQLPGTEITALERFPSTEESGVRWLVGDLCSPKDCSRFVTGQEIIIHLAHTNSPLTSDADLVRDASDNLLPTLNLLQAVRDEGNCPQFIYPSSGGAIYGLAQADNPFKESTPCLPLNSYGVLKLTVEHYLRLAAQRGHLSATVLRIANAYGWLLSPDRSQGLIGTAISRVLGGHPVRLFGNPANVRDYVHFDDICSAVLRAFDRSAGFEVFNIGSGVGHSVDDVVTLIEHVWGNPVERINEAPANAGFLSDWCVLDIEKARRELGWEPKTSLEEGIQRMFAMAPGR